MINEIIIIYHFWAANLIVVQRVKIVIERNRGECIVQLIQIIQRQRAGWTGG